MVSNSSSAYESTLEFPAVTIEDEDMFVCACNLDQPGWKATAEAVNGQQS